MVMAAVCKAVDPLGWTPPGSQTFVGEVGGVLGRQTVPASKQATWGIRYQASTKKRLS